MKSIHFPNLDLNLLRVFEALSEERSVTRAGERLGLTQSAVSHALGRLRVSLDDELFVRTAEGMRPTPWAAEAAPRVARALGQLQRALAPNDFEPGESDRRFALGMAPYLTSVLAPGLVHAFRQRAPNAELVLRHQERSLSEALDTGRLDVAVGVFGRASERFERRTLFEERLVWALRRDHPAASRPLTLDVLASLPHLIVSSADSVSSVDTTLVDNGLERMVIWDDGGAYLGAMKRAGRHHISGMAAPDSQAALTIAARTDMAALAPRRLAEKFKDTLGLALFESPYDGRPVDVVALWRKDHGAHPAVSWLIDLLCEQGALI